MTADTDQQGRSEPDGEVHLWNQWRSHQCGQSRARLAAQHSPFALRLARRQARRIEHGDAHLSDLEQTAHMALLEAIERFDHNRAVPFEAFAKKRIKGALADQCSKLSERADIRQQQKALRARRVADLAKQHKEANADNDLAALRDLVMDLAIGLMLEDEANGDAYVDTAPSASSYPSAYHNARWHELTHHLADAVRHLPDQAASVIRRHYHELISFAEIADELGLTKGRISQIHRAALKELSLSLERRGHHKTGSGSRF